MRLGDLVSGRIRIIYFGFEVGWRDLIWLARKASSASRGSSLEINAGGAPGANRAQRRGSAGSRSNNNGPRARDGTGAYRNFFCLCLVGEDPVMKNNNESSQAWPLEAGRKIETKGRGILSSAKTAQSW